MRVGRESLHQRGNDLPCGAHRVANFRLGRRPGVARVAVPPRIFCQRRRVAKERLQHRVTLDTLTAELAKVVGLPEDPVVPREEPLHRLLDGLLAVKGGVSEQIEIYFSIVQRKVLTPNDFASLAEVEDHLLRFQAHYQRAAAPFEWTFTRQDLAALLARLAANDRVAAA